ncbi:hypothetical protein VPH35_134951 [Triticum aestivum]
MRPSRRLRLVLLLLFSASVLLPAARAQEETDEEEFSYLLDAENGWHTGATSRTSGPHAARATCSRPSTSPAHASPSCAASVTSTTPTSQQTQPSSTAATTSCSSLRVTPGASPSPARPTFERLCGSQHWHSPTEHSINGRRYDMELHMFHQSTQGKAAVIGIFYEVGAYDAFLHKMIADRKDREEKMGMMDPRDAKGKARVLPLSGLPHHTTLHRRGHLDHHQEGPHCVEAPAGASPGGRSRRTQVDCGS